MKITIKNLEIEISREELKALQYQNQDIQNPENQKEIKKETKKEIENKKIGF